MILKQFTLFSPVSSYTCVEVRVLNERKVNLALYSFRFLFIYRYLTLPVKLTERHNSLLQLLWPLFTLPTMIHNGRQTVCGFFYVLQDYEHCMKGCETGPTVYRPYSRGLETLTICRCQADTKAALSPQLFKDPDLCDTIPQYSTP